MAEPMDDPAEQPRGQLAALDFVDLYVSAAGEGFFRPSAISTLCPLPPHLQDCLLHLLQLLAKRAAARPDRREYSISYEATTYRVALLEAIDGLWYVLRRGPARVPGLTRLGIHPRLVAALIELGRAQNRGIVVIAGKTGEGKSTTAGALLAAWLDYFGGVAVTIEDPPEFPLHGVKRGGQGYCFQREVQEKNFSEALAAALRYTPRYIFLGEVRSEATAREALRACVNGHLVLTTLHAGSIEEAIHRLLDLAVEGQDRRAAQAVLADGIAAVIHQRLLGEAGERRLELRFLFGGPTLADPARAIIRSGRIEQLGTEIESQVNRMFRGGGGRWSSS